MTPAELKAARHRLGLSVRQMADALDPSEPPNPRTVQRWEAGDSRIPRWVPPRLEALLRDADRPAS